MSPHIRALWNALADAGDFEKLWETAFWLNRGEGVDPRLGKYSTGTPTLP